MTIMPCKVLHFSNDLQTNKLEDATPDHPDGLPTHYNLYPPIAPSKLTEASKSLPRTILPTHYDLYPPSVPHKPTEAPSHKIGKKRKQIDGDVSVEMANPIKSLTRCNSLQREQEVVYYVTDALKSARWETFFDRIVNTRDIQADYARWYVQVINSGITPIKVFPFMQILGKLIPIIKHQRGSIRFPKKEICQAKWNVKQEEITKKLIKQILPQHGVTVSGKEIVQYITYALTSKRWATHYFGRVVNNCDIQTDYALWHKRTITSGILPYDVRPLMKVLNGLIPATLRYQKPPCTYFPEKRVCQIFWIAAQAAIQEWNSNSSVDTLKGYLLRSSNRMALKGTIPISTLFADYRKWLLNNGYSRGKALPGFTKDLLYLVKCKISSSGKHLIFQETEQNAFHRTLIDPPCKKDHTTLY